MSRYACPRDAGELELAVGKDRYLALRLPFEPDGSHEDPPHRVREPRAPPDTWVYVDADRLPYDDVQVRQALKRMISEDEELGGFRMTETPMVPISRTRPWAFYRGADPRPPTDRSPF